MRRFNDQDVFEAALDRFKYMLRTGHVCISFSAGKDSTLCMELAILAAQDIGHTDPIDVVYRDEECVSPETTAFALRTSQRPEVRFHWCIAHQPIINIFNRQLPYVWTYDPLVDPDDWMQQPPPIAKEISDINIERLITHERLGISTDKILYVVVGIRTSESTRRKMAINASKGYLTRPEKNKCNARPVYDWVDEDVWKFTRDLQIDYNLDYDIMYRLGVPKRNLRIAPLTMATASLHQLGAMAKAYPKWFEKLGRRCPGVRLVTHFGLRAVQPERKVGETWQDCFERVCVTDAPPWIRDRALIVKEKFISAHARASSDPMPQKGGTNFQRLSWEQLTKVMYNGDPFCMKINDLPYVEPEFFRPGSGRWGGKPAF